MDVNELNARRETDGRFGSRLHREDPAVKLPAAAPRPGVDAMKAMAEDLMNADGAEPVTEAEARNQASAYAAAEITRSCVAEAKVQVRRGNTAQATILTVAISSLSQVPAGLMAAGGNLERGGNLIGAARLNLKAAAAKVDGAGRRLLDIVDERLAGMEDFLREDLSPVLVGNQPVPPESLAAVRQLEAVLADATSWNVLDKASDWAESQGYETGFLDYGRDLDSVHCPGAIFIDKDGEWEIGVSGTGRRNSSVDSEGTVDQMDYEGDENGKIYPIQYILPWKKEQAA